MNTEKSIQTEIIIKASKERIWSILTDTGKYHEWNPFIVSMKGKIEVGNTLVNVMKNGESLMTFKPTVLKVIPNAYFEWLGKLFVSGLFDGKHYFQLEDAGNGYVKLIHGEKFKGIMSNFILKKIGETTKNGFIQMNQAIKSRAESGSN